MAQVNYSDSGLVFIKKSSFTNIASASIDNCFSADYSQYKIIFDCISASSPSDSQLRMRLRVGGSDNTSQNYPYQEIQVSSTTVSATRPTTNTAWQVVSRNDTYAQISIVELLNPFQSTYTTGFAYISRGIASSPTLYASVLGTTVTTSYDGFTVFNIDGLNITGTMYVYGYKKS